MALEGSIQEFGLTEIFQLILLQKKEGVLTLVDGKKSISVAFKEGEIVQAEDHEGEEGLINALLKSEKITVDQVKKGVRRRNNKTLIQTLVDLGYITPDQLRRPVRTFTEERIYQLFGWKSGNYKFEQKEIRFDSKWVEPIKTEFILMEGMRRIDEWPGLLKKVKSNELVFEPIASEVEERPAENKKEGGEASFDAMGDLGGEEEGNQAGWLLPWIDGIRTVQEIIDRSEMGAFPVYKGLADSLAEGKIQVKEGSGGIRAKGADAVSLRRFSGNRLILRGLLNAAAVLVSIITVVYSYPSFRFVFDSTLASIQEIKDWTVWNERDRLIFALDLYHLRYRRYPDSLEPLVKEG
ncbi:MAG TPA: DUF4388 domain-containing protein, partial [Candidatus Manganitrophaceae bacterium]